MSVHLFGIRHHGPGSARSLRRALERLQPDVVLVEGPPDADALLPLLAHPEMELPAALLVYAADEPGRAVYYPFAQFSPETVAIRHALTRGVPVRFMDLPVAYSLPQSPRHAEIVARESSGPGEPPGPLEVHPAGTVRLDPLGALAEAAGFSDGERWWEHLVESRRGDDADVFEAVLEAMTALREHADDDDEHEATREAHMRQTIRSARKEGFGCIAVVCGAWHAPALRDLRKASEDARRLKGLPKMKVNATWVPWTHGRLARASGYGAGVESPGWYQHLFSVEGDVLAPWMTRVARLLREAGLDASSASVIEAVRLARSLAAMRTQALPGLAEVTEAARAVFCWDSDLPMQLIHERLVVGEVLGAVPSATPGVPLAQHVATEQRRLRLKPEALKRDLDLDLRNHTDLERSALLHRLRLLNVAWGEPRRVYGAKGTFREGWQLQWQPEFAVRLIEASLWGPTVEAAAQARAEQLAHEAPDLPALTELLDAVMLAALPDAAQVVLQQLSNEAARASDVSHLMAALPPLARVARYGDVRGTDTARATAVFDALFVRACIGLPGACASLNDDAANTMREQINATQGAVTLLQHDDHRARWTRTLAKLTDVEGMHGLIAGRATRLLLDLNAVDAPGAARRLGLALSPVTPPANVAAFLEGFLEGSGLILVHDPQLFRLLDDWVASLTADAFQEVLPLLRRTFSLFAAPERRALGEHARAGESRSTPSLGGDVDHERAALVLPLVRQLLGVEVNS